MINRNLLLGCIEEAMNVVIAAESTADGKALMDVLQAAWDKAYKLPRVPGKAELSRA